MSYGASVNFSYYFALKPNFGALWNIENPLKYESSNLSNKRHRRKFHENKDLDVNVESNLLRIFDYEYDLCDGLV